MRLTGIDSHKCYGNFVYKSEANAWLVSHFDQPLVTHIYKTIHGPRHAILPESIVISNNSAPHDISYWLNKLVDEYGSVFLAPDNHLYLQLIRVKAGFDRIRKRRYVERGSYKNWSVKVAERIKHEAC